MHEAKTLIMPFVDLICAKAREHHLEAELVGAICLKESLGQSFAMRYEPLFFRRYILPMSLAGRNEKIVQGVLDLKGSSAKGSSIILSRDDSDELLSLSEEIASGSREPGEPDGRGQGGKSNNSPDNDSKWLRSLAVKLQDVDRVTLLNDETEARGRAFSWGLGQVMGQVARERGFSGPYLSALCEPVMGLEYLCRQLKHLLLRYGSVPDAVAAYNQGNRRWRDVNRDGFKGDDEPYHNQHYVDGVFRLRASVRDAKVF